MKVNSINCHLYCSSNYSPNKILLTVFTSAIFLTVSLSSAQHVSFGFCPRVSPVPDFNITRLEGKWYEIERYMFLPLLTSTCTSVQYLDKGDGSVVKNIYFYDTLTSRFWKIYGILKYRRKDGSADFNYYMVKPKSLLPFRFPYMFIDTDYTTYAVEYSCKQIGMMNLQVMWVISKNKRQMDKETRKMVHAKIRRLGLDTARLKVAEQVGCLGDQ